MARVKISEYRAKKILLGDTYKGVQLRSDGTIVFPKGTWVLKVDQGVKKRYKQGLLAIDKTPAEFRKAIRSWEKKGFSQFLLEPLLPHEGKEEQYLSLERVREGVRILHARDGGVDIETHPEAVRSYLIRNSADIQKVARDTDIPEVFIKRTYEVFNKDFFVFLEINPLVVSDGEAYALDAAALVDSAGAFFTHGWSEDDIVKAKLKHKAEKNVEELARTTPASLKLSVINPDGSLFFLLSGGGGSIVIADEAQLEGAGNLVANYGEYSGGPTREETYLYAKEIIGLVLHSKTKSAQGGSASGRKALVIAGGVANFTDVRATFLGIIDAMRESAVQMRKQHVKVFVRRGGPNEAAGLELMRAFLEEEKFLGSIHGSDAVITKAVEDAVSYLRI